MRKSCTKKRGNFPRGVVNLGATASARVFADEARELLPRLLVGMPAKIVARETGATLRTVEGWKRGDHAPSLANVGVLMVVLPGFAEFMRRWAGHCLEPELFDNEQRAFNDFAARKMRGTR